MFASFHSQFPGKFKIMVTAEIHAENDYEAGVVHSPACNRSVRPKVPSKQENIDEIFSIPADIGWRIISKDLDAYRQTNEEPCTLSTSEENNVNPFKIYQLLQNIPFLLSLFVVFSSIVFLTE